MSAWPCLDDSRRYRSFPCSQCTAPTCLFGRKPGAPASHRPVFRNGERLPLCERCGLPVKPNTHGNVPLTHSGCKAPRLCEYCSAPFSARFRNRYCSETCRYQMMLRRRRARKAGTQTGGQGRAKKAYAGRNQHGAYSVPAWGREEIEAMAKQKGMPDEIGEAVGRLHELTSEERDEFVDRMQGTLGLARYEPDNPTWRFWSLLRSYCLILNRPGYKRLIELDAWHLVYAVWDLSPEEAQQLLDAPKADLPRPVALALDQLVRTHPDLPE